MDRKAVLTTTLTLMLLSMLTLAFDLQAAETDTTTVCVYPSIVEATVGTSFTVEIRISDVIDMFSWQVRLEWNATILDFVSAEEGDFLEDQPWGTIFLKVTEQDNIGTDYVVAFCTTLGDWPGVSGSGTLATVTFLVEDVGKTVLQFYNPYPAEPTDTFLLDSDVAHIDFVAEDGFFTKVVGLLATVDVAPDTLNLKSEGKWITAFLQFPEEFDPEDIDAATILLNETLQPVLDPKYDFVTNPSVYLVDHDDGILERMVKFDKAEVIALLNIGEAILTITGEVKGIPFEGSDTIRVTS